MATTLAADADSCTFFEVDVTLRRSGEKLGLAVGMTEEGTIIVAEIDADSPAERATLQRGDQILAVNGRAVVPDCDLEELRQAVDALRVHEVLYAQALGLFLRRVAVVEERTGATLECEDSSTVPVD